MGQVPWFPLDPSTIGALSDYARTRDRLCPAPRQPSFFVSARGTRLVYSDIRRTLLGLARRAGTRQARQAAGSAACAASFFRRRHPARLVPGRRRRAGPAAASCPPTWATLARLDLLVPVGRPGAARPGRRPPRARPGRAAMSALAPTLQAFFTERLIGQRQASPHTVAAYRDALRLLLAFASERTGKQPRQLDFDRPRRPADRRVPGPPGDETGATARAPATPGWPRSTPCSASRPCATPSTPPLIARVLAIPPSGPTGRSSRYLTREEIDALLAAPTASPGPGAATTPCC